MFKNNNSKINCESAIGKHLIINPEYTKTYTDDNFRVIKQARSSFHLRPHSHYTGFILYTFLIGTDIKMLHVHTISHSVWRRCTFHSASFTSLSFLWKFSWQMSRLDSWLTLENKTDFSSERASGTTMYWIHASKAIRSISDSSGIVWMGGLSEIGSNPICDESGIVWMGPKCFGICLHRLKLNLV